MVKKRLILLIVLIVGFGIGIFRAPIMRAVTAPFDLTIQMVDSLGNIQGGTASATTANPDRTVRVVDSTNHVLDSFGLSGPAPGPIGGTTSSTGQFTKLASGTSPAVLPPTQGWGSFEVNGSGGNCVIVGSHIATFAGIYFGPCNGTPGSSTNGYTGSTSQNIIEAVTSTALNINGNQRVLITDTAVSANNGNAIQSTGGAAPTISAGCNGAGSSVTAGSTNNRGQVTTQTAAATTCTISFSAAGVWAQAPFCIAADSQAQITPAAYSVGATTTSTFVVDFVSASNDKFNYVCF